MSLELLELEQGKLLEVHVTGKLTKEAYELFVPAFEQQVETHGKIRVLFIMHDFHGWSAGALWEDIKLEMKHGKHIERLAIVGETKWERGMATFCKPFTSANIQYFDHADVEKARAWIQE